MTEEGQVLLAAIIAGSVVSVITAVFVPWLTYRSAFRAERWAWIRERQADLYVDLRMEATAEFEWLKAEAVKRDIELLVAEHAESEQHRVAVEEAMAKIHPVFEDQRMSVLDRRRLEARMTYASLEVQLRWHMATYLAHDRLRIHSRDQGVQFHQRCYVWLAGLEDAIQRDANRLEPRLGLNDGWWYRWVRRREWWKRLWQRHTSVG